MVGGHDCDQVVAEQRQLGDAARDHAVVDDGDVEAALHEAGVDVVAGDGDEGDFDVGPQG